MAHDISLWPSIIENSMTILSKEPFIENENPMISAHAEASSATTQVCASDELDLRHVSTLE
jgi:hypothetical protein